MEFTKRMQIYNIQTSIDNSKWDEFVFLHPFGNIFQTRYMSNVYENTKRYHPVKLFAVNKETDELCGVLCAVMLREINGPLSNYSVHSIIRGGPLVEPGLEKVVIPLLVSEHDKLVQGKAIYSEIRNLHDVQTLLDLPDYEYEDHLNYIINLDQPEEDLWHQIHQARRKNINRAQKKGVVIEEMSDIKLMPIFYKILIEAYKNARIPLAHRTLFEAAFKVFYPANMVKIFFAKHCGNYIGARAVMLYKDIIYDWYAGASRKSLGFYPNDYLVWYILKWGMKNGYALFDFGGAGKPNVEYGPREFKRRFGGELVNYGRNVNIYSPLKMKVTKIGFRVYRRLFS